MPGFNQVFSLRLPESRIPAVVTSLRIKNL